MKLMYEHDSDMDAKPTTLPMYPRRPSPDDPRWRDVAVRSRTRNQTNITRFPADGDEIEITTIYAGDTIAIIPEVQFHYYVAARIGYHVGWVNFKHVKLLSLKPGKRGTLLNDTKPDVPPDRDERIAQHQEMQKRLYREEQERLYQEEQERLYQEEQERLYQEEQERLYREHQQQLYNEAQERAHREQERLYQEAQQRIYEAHQESELDNCDYEYDEQETQPAPIERQTPSIPKSDVNRIINKLKNLGGLFSRR